MTGTDPKACGWRISGDTSLSVTTIGINPVGIDPETGNRFKYNPTDILTAANVSVSKEILNYVVGTCIFVRCYLHGLFLNVI